MEEYPVIKPDSDFENNFNFNEKEQEILSGALNLNSGQSTFQSKFFVANSQLTPYRMLKQCLLELEARHQSYFDMKNKLKRKKVEIRIAQKLYHETEDELEQELIIVDIESMQHDIDVWDRKIKQAAEEVVTFMELAKEIAGDDDTLLQKAYGYDEEEERDYWIARMSKQAAMDMMSSGRIGTGNLDSIAMMDDEAQVATLARTLQYTQRLSEGMAKIGEAVSNGLLEQQDNLPKYDIPSVTDKLMVEELINDVQHSAKPKIKPESI